MVRLLKIIANTLGIEISQHIPPGKDDVMVSLTPKGARRGNVLLSYVIDPFLRGKTDPISNDHTHHWESYQIAQTFLRQGFAVDVVSYRNFSFVPQKSYTLFVGARTNFERITSLLNTDCVKVAHLDTAHWLFNNAMAYQRLLALQQRRGIALHNVKMVESNWAIEQADVATILGNQFTIDTYAYAKKPIHRIPISAPSAYPWDEQKDFHRCRNNYLWFGSSGFVHKGLDLVLEAFAQMPDYHLTVCGPFDQEAGFVKAFHKELYESPNIHAVGWVDVASPRFLELARNCIGLVYPTCSEGGGGSAITCMHAGMVPVLSYEASVDIGDSGILLSDNTINEIKAAVAGLSSKPVTELERLARAAWTTARDNHTRDIFASEYEKFVLQVLLKKT